MRIRQPLGFSIGVELIKTRVSKNQTQHSFSGIHHEMSPHLDIEFYLNDTIVYLQQSPPMPGRSIPIQQW